MFYHDSEHVCALWSDQEAGDHWNELVGRLPWDLVSWRGDPRAPRCPMSRHRKDPLRPLTADERQELTRLSRSLSAPAPQVERSRALPSALGHCGWRELHGCRPPGRTTAHRDDLRLGQPP